jgi:hypothetical protein
MHIMMLCPSLNAMDLIDAYKRPCGTETLRTATAYQFASYECSTTTLLAFRFHSNSEHFHFFTAKGFAGTPEGVIAAAALKCLGGSLQGRLYPRNESERDAAVQQGYQLDKVHAPEHSF